MVPATIIIILLTFKKALNKDFKKIIFVRIKKNVFKKPTDGCKAMVCMKHKLMSKLRDGAKL